jgi:2-keto-3-deoxy-L-rhamnonate aldolase RhmA
MTPPWASGRTALGAWVKIPAVEVVELLAIAGVDFVVIDREHGVHDLRTVSTMISVALGAGIAPFVRVPGHSPRDVVPVLDAGAAGLFVPHVDSVEDAEAVVAACRFPPLGRRGAGPTSRAGRWGRAGLSLYLAEADRVTLVAQLESPSAVADGLAVAAVPGIDAVFIGPVDLAVSAGRDPGDDRLRAMVSDLETRAAAAGTVIGTTAAAGGEVAGLAGRGHRFVVVGNDSGFLLAGAERTVHAGRVARSRPTEVRSHPL